MPRMGRVMCQGAKGHDSSISKMHLKSTSLQEFQMDMFCSLPVEPGGKIFWSDFQGIHLRLTLLAPIDSYTI